MTTNLTAHQLYERADQARKTGDRARARDLTDRAVALDLERAAGEVATAEDALQTAQLRRHLAMHDARDRGWSYTRIANVVGLSQQRVNQVIGGTS